MPQLDPAFINDVRQANDIVEVIGEYVRLEKRGNDFWGLCPFHSEKTPSFSVSPRKQFFHCFGCQANGNAIQFVQRRENISFPAAVETLAKRARIPLPKVERSPEEEAAHREREQMYGALDLAARYFAHQLGEPQGKEALAYLKGRGLTDETIRRFRLGYAGTGWDGLLRSLRGRYPEAVLFRVGLLSRREGSEGYYDRFRDRAMFPIADLRGRIIGFGGRVMGDQKDTAKYLNSTDSPLFSKRRTLYALHLAKDTMRSANQAIIVEGYMDAIAAHQAGVSNVVASLGTALSAEQSKALREQVAEVVIAYDSDTAGQNATMRGLDLLSAAGCDIKVLRLPQGKDPDELIRNQGAAAFIQSVTKALPLIEFKLKLALEAHNGAGNDAEIKAAALHEVLPILRDIPTAIKREEYAREVAELLNVPEETLRRDLRRMAWRTVPGVSAHNAGRNRDNTVDTGLGARQFRMPTDPVQYAEVFLLRLVLAYPHLVERMWAELPDAFSDQPLLERLARAIDGHLSGSQAVAALMEQVEDPEARSLLVTLQELPTKDPERDFVECIATIHKHTAQRRIDDLQKRLREAPENAVAVLAQIREQQRKLKATLTRNIK